MNNMRKLRLAKGLSMRDVAKELGLPYTTYVNYEKGDREPSSETLILVADYYNTTVDYLIGRTNTSEPLIARQSLSTKEDALLSSFHQLNEEGQDKLVDTADDLVRSGKYVIKSDSNRLGKEA